MTSEKTTKKTSNRFVRFFGVCVNKIWLLLASSIILLSLLHILLVFLLPKIDVYRDEIIEWAEQKYGVDIAVDRISAEWSVEGPVVTLSNFRIETANKNIDVLKVGDVSLYFNILTSLWNQRIATQDIIIDNANISFDINQTLGVDLDIKDNSNSTQQGINGEDDSSSIDFDHLSEQIINRLFDQRKVTLTNSKISLRTRAGTEFKYYVDQVVVRKFGDRHQLLGELLNDTGAKLSLVIELYGDPSYNNSYSRVYASGTDIDISQLPWLKNFQIDKPTAGKLSLEFWGTWKQKHWQKASIALSLTDANWTQSKIDLKTSQISTKNIERKGKNQVSLLASWENDHSTEGYLALHHLEFKTPDIEKQVESDIVLKFTRREKSTWSWDIVADKFNIASAANYFGFVMDQDTELSHFLIEAKPAVTIERLHLNINRKAIILNQLPTEKITQNISLSFSNLDYLPWNDMPRANGLSGRLTLTEHSGKASLFGENISLEFDQLFRKPLTATTLNAEILWDFNDGIAENFELERFSFINEDVIFQTKARFFEQDEQSMMSVYTEILNLDVGKLSDYLPTGIMKKSLVKYLDEGIVSGEMTSIKSIIRGPMSGFPYPDNNGVFIALGQLNNTGYRYLSDWPMAKGMKASLLFDGNGMDITASHAHVDGNKVLNARAVINDFSNVNPLLKLSLEIKSKDNSATKFLTKTPISFISDALETIDLKGQLRTKINLQVGMSDSKTSPLKLKGRVSFDPKSSILTTSYLTASKIEGEVKFSENSLEKSQLKLDYKGKRLSVALHGKQNAKDAAITLNVKGVMPASGIADFIGKEWAGKFTGESIFTTLVQFSPVDKPDTTQILILSDLKGIAVDLPGEFSKLASETSEMYLLLNLSDRSTGRIRWNGLSGMWYWNDKLNTINTTALVTEKMNNINDDTVSYGGDFAVNVAADFNRSIAPGIRVSGELGDVGFMPWWDLINEVVAVKMRHSSEREAKIDDSLLIESMELKLSNLSMSNLKIDNVILNLAKPLNESWSVNVKSDQGRLFFQPNREKPWIVKLDHIKLNFIDKLEPRQAENNQQDSDVIKEEIVPVKTTLTQSSLRPSDLENIDFSCQQCVIQDSDYGDVFMRIRKTEKGIKFNGYSTKEKQHELTLAGSWLEYSQSADSSAMAFELSSPDIGALLKQWGVDVAIEDSSGDITATIDWLGAPWQIDYTQIKGSAHATLGKGVLSELSDGKGRLFSLLNLQSLARRLTLDFKDVFQKGFFFDSIEGTFLMDGGVISTENVQIKGNVADVKLYGITDVKNEKIEQLAVVSPHLTSSFPLLAAWAIEPTTGVIVFLVGKIMEPVIEVVTRIEYRVHGSFDAPIVDQIDRSKKKIKKEEFLSQQQEKSDEEKRAADKLRKENKSENKVVEPID